MTRRSRSARAPPESATSASRPRCTGGRSSSRSPWWPHWRRRSSTASAATTRSRASLSAGTVVTLALLLTRLYGPLTALSNARVDVMSALVSFDRVFEVLDLAPMIARRRRRGGAAGATRAASSSATSGSPTRARTRCRLPRSRTSPRWTRPPSSEVLHGRLVPGRARRADRARRAFRRRQDDDQPAGAAHLRRAQRRGARRRLRRADGDADSRCTTVSASSARKRTCSTTPSAATCSTPRPEATDDELLGCRRRGTDRRPGACAARRPGHPRRRPRLPALGR